MICSGFIPSKGVIINSLPFLLFMKILLDFPLLGSLVKYPLTIFIVVECFLESYFLKQSILPFYSSTLKNLLS